jgi:hypothetical protein
MVRLKLTNEESDKLLHGIDEARRMLSKYQGELTEDDIRSLLRENLGDALTLILKNHKDERMLT